MEWLTREVLEKWTQNHWMKRKNNNNDNQFSRFYSIDIIIINVLAHDIFISICSCYIVTRQEKKEKKSENEKLLSMFDYMHWIGRFVFVPWLWYDFEKRENEWEKMIFVGCRGFIIKIYTKELLWKGKKNGNVAPFIAKFTIPSRLNNLKKLMFYLMNAVFEYNECWCFFLWILSLMSVFFRR